MPIGDHENGASRSANRRIHDDHMHGVTGKIIVSLRDGDGAIKNVERIDRIGDINDLGFGVELEDDTLHDAHVVVAHAKVSGKCDDAVSHECPYGCKVNRDSSNADSILIDVESLDWEPYLQNG